MPAFRKKARRGKVARYRQSFCLEKAFLKTMRKEKSGWSITAKRPAAPVPVKRVIPSASPRFTTIAPAASYLM
jgi:hypothetical protein